MSPFLPYAAQSRLKYLLATWCISLTVFLISQLIKMRILSWRPVSKSVRPMLYV